VVAGDVNPGLLVHQHSGESGSRAGCGRGKMGGKFGVGLPVISSIVAGLHIRNWSDLWLPTQRRTLPLPRRAGIF
jgi:hypothetical protein